MRFGWTTMPVCGALAHKPGTYVFRSWPNGEQRTYVIDRCIGGSDGVDQLIVYRTLGTYAEDCWNALVRWWGRGAE